MEEFYLQDIFLDLVPIAEMCDVVPFVTPDAIIEVLELPVDDESVYGFELREGSVFSFGVSADQIFDLVLCHFEDYESWLDSIDPEAELLALEARFGVMSTSITFRATRSMYVAVIVTNSSESPIQALVEAQS